MHCGECAAPIAIFWLRRTPEQSYTQVRDDGEAPDPGKLIRPRVESGRAGRPNAPDTIAGHGPGVADPIRRPGVTLTTERTRRAGKHTPAQKVRALFDSWLLAAKVKPKHHVRVRQAAGSAI